MSSSLGVNDEKRGEKKAQKAELSTSPSRKGSNQLVS